MNTKSACSVRTRNLKSSQTRFCDVARIITYHTFKVKLASLALTLTASLINWRLEMRAKNFVVNRGISCVNRGISCFNRGVSCLIRCILSCVIRCNPVFQSWSSRRERVKTVELKQRFSV